MYYISNCKKNIIIINFKVCYSTFEIFKLNGYIENYSIDPKTINNYNVYIIVRDPIKKILSFYKDKILNQVKYLKVFNQYCTQELLLFNDKDFIISDNYNFSSFLNCMKKGYNDEHISKQCIHYNYIKNFYNKNINIIKLEDLNFNNILSNILNINIDIIKEAHANKTENITINLSYDDELFIKDYYKDDYKIFSY